MAGFWLGFLVGIAIMISIFAFGIYRFKKMTQSKTDNAMEILTSHMKNIQTKEPIVEEDIKEQGTKEDFIKEE